MYAYNPSLTHSPIERQSFLAQPYSPAESAISKAECELDSFAVNRAARGKVSPEAQRFIDILKMGVTIWNEWRSGEPLTKPNLRNADLSELALENVNFTGADLRGANFNNAYLYDADFQGANLKGASLERAVLIGANFHRANLSAASLRRAYLASSDLSNANLTKASLQEADLQLALLTDATLTRAEVKGADMSACYDLTELQLKQSKDGHLACLEAETGSTYELPAVEADCLSATEVVMALHEQNVPHAHPSKSQQPVRELSLTRAQK